ncbi:MAG: hypothetical protein ACTHKF_03720, partial [Candidatus Nitrosocosmicus sp.]
MSFICDICHRSTGSLYSKLIAEIKEKKNNNDNDNNNDNNISNISSSSITIKSSTKKSQMAHIECCSYEQIKQILLS